MPWYAIRTVYHFGTKEDGTSVFEERVVCFEAASWDEAYVKADAESTEYARVNEVRAHPAKSGYEQDGEPLLDGYELWSELFESRDTLEGFFANRYTVYEYHPPS